MHRRGALWSSVAAVAGLGALSSMVAALANVDQAATATAQAQRLTGEAIPIEPIGPALLVSDSAWLAIHTYSSVDGLQGFDLTFDLASCRRRVSTSCENYNGLIPITLLDEIELRGDGYDTLIVATGYNDSDTTFRDDFDAIIDLTRSFDYQRIIWLTLRTNVTYTSPDDIGFSEVYVRNNQALADLAATGDYPELVIADWASYAEAHPEWFASDGIHLRSAGTWSAVDYVSRKVAFLDRRACPQPQAVGQPLQTPCPDPDASPAAVDLYSLYPVGQQRPGHEGLRLEWEGSSSWPDPPWWQL